MKKIYKIAGIFILALSLFLPTGISHAKKSRGAYRTSYRTVIFSDSTKGKRLFGSRVHDRILPASTVKVLTVLLVLENLPLDQYVTVGHKATVVQPSKLFLRAGEQYKVRDLLYALLLSSSNDASVVLAEAVAGSEENFVRMMNARAKQLGAKNSRFANCHGLPSAANQYSSAYDMYLIYRQALKNAFFEQGVQKKFKVIYSRSGRKLILKNHNKMLFFDWRKAVYGKTGWTRKAGGCFLGHVEKGDSKLIIGIFGCSSKRWSDIRHIITKYSGVKL
ncbi:MAG: D-alanyl-D-alanine carboxypeptidase [Candidatus Omnitrophica bacterium]|nr:D-alanyl-D-alanine carboxypeptidase [Candidatus Omnitrophota bacterium]